MAWNDPNNPYRRGLAGLAQQMGQLPGNATVGQSLNAALSGFAGGYGQGQQEQEGLDALLRRLQTGQQGAATGMTPPTAGGNGMGPSGGGMMAPPPPNSGMGASGGGMMVQPPMGASGGSAGGAPQGPLDPRLVEIGNRAMSLPTGGAANGGSAGGMMVPPPPGAGAMGPSGGGMIQQPAMDAGAGSPFQGLDPQQLRRALGIGLGV